MVDKDTIKRFFNVNKLSITEISKKTGITPEEVEKIVLSKPKATKKATLAEDEVIAEEEVAETPEEEEVEEKPVKKEKHSKKKKSKN